MQHVSGNTEVSINPVESHNQSARRLVHIRNAPIAFADRDILLFAESWLSEGLEFPEMECFGQFFACSDARLISPLTQVADYVAAIVTMHHRLELRDPATYDRVQIESAIHIYLTETQRILSGLFAPDHPFWHQFYQRRASIYFQGDRESRVRHRYALYLVPLDALHHITGSKHHLQYELLLQSLGAILTGFIARSVSHSEADPNGEFRRALRITRNYDLPCYEEWVTGLIESSNHNENQQS